LTRITNLPEFGIVVFSFLLNFVWEMLQVPTYACVAAMPHWQGVKMCTQATFGDVGFALTAFWLTALAARSRCWFVESAGRFMALYIAVSIVLTIGFEFYHVNISGRWVYFDRMVVVPLLDIGSGPLLQWLIIPPLVLWFTRRHLKGEIR